MSGQLETPRVPRGERLAGRSALEYATTSTGYDELLDAAGAVRERWQPFLDGLDRMGLPELLRAWDEARHLIREHGITYNIHGDPRGLERTWQLDPVPLLISTDEARRLEAGLTQRARLLELILADLHGPQRLLAERWLPPELLHSNPSYLRPCHGIPPAGGRFLTLYGANLSRASDGSFLCLGDRTQAPSGAGYALENRIVVARMLPGVFGEMRVERLAHFFQAFREVLRSLAPSRADNPRIVLLTPGPHNETYFEHALLARYLGFTLVEGGDLTVRDNRVYLKVLGGLQPVDVILRRLDDDYCDPLELRPDSFLGVPGLVHAARQGNVAIANALGAGLVEAPAFLAFLPGLARRLLGEDLELPSVPTWWCGDPASLTHVLDNLDRMVIKPAFAAARLEPIFGGRLSVGELAALAARIRSRPADFAAQEQLPPSTAPVLAGERFEPRTVVLRAYLSAQADGYTMLPGGLTRFSARQDMPAVSMQSGGGSKDTWILASGPVSPFSLLPTHAQPVELSRADGDLPSRAADNLLWLGRYAERAEGLTRLLRGIVSRLTERSVAADTPELVALTRALPPLGSPRESRSAAESSAGATGAAELLPAYIFDRDRSGTLPAATAAVKRVASLVRDRISIDMWRVIDRCAELATAVGEASETGGRRDADRRLREGSDVLDRAVLALSAFGGLASESMTRGAGWRFLDIGRRLERCLHTLRLLDAALGTSRGNEGPILEAVLEVAESSMTYRRRYLGDLQTAAALDLLLTDNTNPRSLVYQLAAIALNVRHLPERDRRLEENLVLDLLAQLQIADMRDLASVDANGTRLRLRSLLRRLASGLPSLSDLITERYLSHLQASRHLIGMRGGRAK